MRSFTLYLCFIPLLAARAGISQTLPDASPRAPSLQFVFEETVQLGSWMKFGDTPLGSRTLVPITGGTIQGPVLRGRILPGGWDWQLATAGGCRQFRAAYSIETDDHVRIRVDNRAKICPDKESTVEDLFTAPEFEAPLGRYQWLNSGAYIGVLHFVPGGAQPEVTIRIYRAKAL